jgi:peroxiredoxin
MRTIRTPLSKLFISLVTTICLALSSQLAHAQATVGAPAPEFTAKDSTGKEVSLKALKGKIVVLEWFNPGCPFVKKFYKNGDMQKTQQELESKGVVWLTISSSAPGKSGHLSPEEAESARAELGMKSTALVLDHNGAIGKAFGARTTPHMFVISPDGVVAYAGAIDSEPSASSADIAGATNYVLNAVTSLKAGKQVEPASTDPYGCSVKY